MKSNPCKECKYSAICFGLDIQATLQCIVDRHEDVFQAWANKRRSNGTAFAGPACGEWLPTTCPDYSKEDWFILTSSGGKSKVYHL